MENSLLIKNVLLDGERRNILVRDGRFVCLDAAPGAEAARTIEAEGLAILPAFYNTHTHAAMTLMRGYGDDRPLHEWLEQTNREERSVMVESLFDLLESATGATTLSDDIGFLPLEEGVLPAVMDTIPTIDWSNGGRKNR